MAPSSPSQPGLHTNELTFQTGCGILSIGSPRTLKLGHRIIPEQCGIVQIRTFSPEQYETLVDNVDGYFTWAKAEHSKRLYSEYNKGLHRVSYAVLRNT